MGSEQAQADAETAEAKVAAVRIKSDEAVAAEKKAMDVLEAQRRAKESAQKTHTLAKKETAFKTTRKSLHDREAEEREALKTEKAAKKEVKSRQRARENAVAKMQSSTAAIHEAINDKIAAAQDSTLARQTQEKGKKVAERFQSLTDLIAKRDNQRKTIAKTMTADEKKYKAASDKAKDEA